jgi:hypothetical protein
MYREVGCWRLLYVNMEIRTETGRLVDIASVEVQEQRLAAQYIRSGDTVLELGARYGSVSCTINAILALKDHQVSVEPDDRVWDALELNRERNGCGFHIVKGVVSSKRWSLTNLDDADGYGTTAVLQADSRIPSFDVQAIQDAYGLTFDVLVADCEGFLESFYNENPRLFDQLRLVVFEADYDWKCDYGRIREALRARGLCEIEHGFYNVWEKPTQ